MYLIVSRKLPQGEQGLRTFNSQLPLCIRVLRGREEKSERGKSKVESGLGKKYNSRTESKRKYLQRSKGYKLAIKGVPGTKSAHGRVQRELL